MVRSVSEFHCLVPHKGRQEPLLNASQQTELAAPPFHYPLNSIFYTTQSQGSYLLTQTVPSWGTFVCSLHKIILSILVTGLNVVKQQHFISNCASTLYKAFWGGKLALSAIIYIIINLSCWYNNKTWLDFS